MKNVFSSHSSVAHAWANQEQESGRASRMFFENNTIYSYGKHFPIARIMNIAGTDFCLFTTRGYSNSTAKHINKVGRANHLPVISMANVPEYMTYDEFCGGKHSDNINVWKNNINDALAKLPRARAKKAQYINAIRYEIRQMETYINTFRVLCDAETLAAIATKDNAEWDNYIAGEATRIAEDAKKRTEAAKIKNIENLAKWRAGEGSYLDLSRSHSFAYDYLRLKFTDNSAFVQTSQNVKIEIEDAKRLFKNLQTLISKGGCTNGNCGKFLNYTISEVTEKFVRIGCHKIEISECAKVYESILQIEHLTA